ncbi:MAG: biotin--[acetyl-CoA-carboxylase] ligase, partial [Nitrospirota bacterium]|nr:biotin--[acetyl-CoA-carboxylase] ligase [Nitrospirota bacterium]
LRAADGEFVSGTDLAEALGVSRTAVWKQVRSLGQEGYVVGSHPRRGYRLEAAPDALSAREVTARLATGWLGKPFQVVDESLSTNRQAMDDLALGHGAVLAAHRQTGGRGRLGRRWETPAGTIPFSLVLAPTLTPGAAALITLTTAVGLAEGIGAVTGWVPDIKWPNDLQWQGRKVAGILTEARTDPDRITRAVVGVGLNINTDLDGLPEEFRHQAASVALAVGHRVSPSLLLAGVLEQLEGVYDLLFEGNGQTVLARYRERCVTLGREVTVHGSDGRRVTGVASGVEEDGALRLDLPDGGVERFHSGDVTLSASGGGGR